MNKSKIVFVHYNSLPGGIEVSLPGIIKCLPRYSFSAFVIRPHPSGKPNVYEGSKMKLQYGASDNISAGAKLFSFAIRNRRSVFHVFNIGPFFLLVLRIARVRYLIYSIHGTQYWNSRKQGVILRFFWKLALSGRYVITANSEYSKRVFLDKVASGREIKVLYNPIDFSRFKPINDRIRSSYPHKIIYCGRLDREKNLDEWIRIAMAILREAPETVFEIYGDGAERQHLQDLINQYKIGNHVVLKGYSDEPEKAMQVADLIMFLSRQESFGNVVVESILCGTPVITGDIPAMKEIFRDFPEFLVNLDENTDETIMLRIKDIERLNRSAVRARESFITRFSPQAHFNSLSELYKNMMQS